MDVKQTHNVSMKGKKVIITGPTSGFGKEIAIQLAILDAEIVLACRDLQRGEQTANEIVRRTGKKNCQVMLIDTSNQKSIHEFAKEYSNRFSHLDVLINNAGINRTQRQMSADGIEFTFATNVLGYYILTQNLLDLLRASAPARIVNVASTFASDLLTSLISNSKHVLMKVEKHIRNQKRVIGCSHGLLHVGSKEAVSLPMPWHPAW